MESKKSITCTCFGFFRRKKSKSSSNEQIQEVSSPRNLSIQSISQPPVSNPLMDLSFIKTQKLVQPNTYKSNIVTSSRRTPHVNKFLPSIFSHHKNAVKPDISNSIETSLSRPNTFRELPINTAAHLFIHRADDGFINKKSPPLEVQKECEEVKEISLIDGRQIKSEEGNEKQEVNLKVCNFTEKFDGLSKKSEQSLIRSPMISPGLLSFSSKFSNSPVMGSLSVSPIKCIVSAEDYSDLVALLNDPEKCKDLPDVFIHNAERPKHMPVLKPMTPCYFARKKAIPTLRLENKELVNKINIHN
ncbi:hypothetical protein SteCoe_17056 [Stentor coeruleus]|uniref:Uncharacterized protein n=1 Tax=Stentor coeruleus TaxID=5963 RepID=A0A1R2BZU8_9CILI|nr:hypothetical protein SteCoe_17056 [Stentor coeruleus]